MPDQPTKRQVERLRSRAWFDNPANVDMTALYLERTMNYGLTLEELQSGRPIIGIAQTGSDITPCNRHHLVLATRVRDGIREAGGVAVRVPDPSDPGDVQAADGGARPQPAVPLARRDPLRLPDRRRRADDRLRQDDAGADHGRRDRRYPGDRPVGRADAERLVQRRADGLRDDRVDGARDDGARGDRRQTEFTELIASSAPSAGHCNTMGTASTMNSLAEALGMSLPGCAAIPAPHRDRQQMAYLTGKRIVEMVWEDLKPSQVLTRAAFENAIVVNSAIGGSTNAPIHLNAIARHVGVELDNDDWEQIGYDVPLLVNMQPAGEYLGEEYYRAGGVPAVVAELIAMGRIDRTAITVNGKSLYENNEGRFTNDRDVIKAHDAPMQEPGRLPQSQGQPVRQRDHEDVGDLGRVPRALPDEPARSERVRGPRDGLRRP